MKVRRSKKSERAQKGTSPPRRIASRGKGIYVVKGGIGAVTVALLTLMFPAESGYEFSEYTEGMISHRRAVAPFTFPVKKSPQELQEDRQNARRSVPLILDYRADVGQKKRAKLDSFFSHLSEVAIQQTGGDSIQTARMFSQRWGLRESTILFLLRLASTPLSLLDFQRICRRLLGHAYEVGLIDDEMTSNQGGFIQIIREGRASENMPSSKVRTLSQTKEGIYEQIRSLSSDENWIEACYDVTTAFLSSNLQFNPEKTQQLRREAVQRVSLYKRLIRKGDIIIDKGERVTAEDIQLLRSLAQEKRARSLEEEPWLRYLLIANQVLIHAALVAIVAGYVYVFRRRAIYHRNGSLLLLSLLLLLPVAVTSYAARNVSLSVFYAPVALSSMLAAILFDVEVAIVLTMVISLLLGSMVGQVGIVLVSSLCGMVGAYMVRKVRHRHQFYRSMGLLPLCYAAAIFAIGFLRATDLKDIGQDALKGALNGLFSPILTIGLLPILETIFSITTDITLLELSDLNHSLLRELATRARGTYNHTMVVSLLAEAAAESIGANPLLAWVGAYYHDIGKMVKPEYFIENQMGIRNPHDHLKPTLSARVLISHVKEGLDMADQHGLPKAISDFIPQHHGTSLMSAFYHRALEQEGKVEEETFRYPGPRPQSKETAIVMLADSVEAAVRSLQDRGPGRVKGMVKSVIDLKLKDGQLDECELTLRDLNRITDSFLRVLMGMAHPRVPYPGQERPIRREGAT